MSPIDPMGSCRGFFGKLPVHGFWEKATKNTSRVCKTLAEAVQEMRFHRSSSVNSVLIQSRGFCRRRKGPEPLLGRFCQPQSRGTRQLFPCDSTTKHSILSVDIYLNSRASTPGVTIWTWHMFRNLTRTAKFFRTAKYCLGWQMWIFNKDLKEKILIGVANFGAYWQPVIMTDLFGRMQSFKPTFMLISVFKALSSLEVYCFLSWQY